MMNSENKGYSLAAINGNNKDKKEKVYLKPMALYVPDIATQAVAELFPRCRWKTPEERDLY